MRSAVALAWTLCATLASAAPQQAEPKSLGEAAKRAREERERKKGTETSGASGRIYGNEDLEERKKAGESNISMPAGSEPLPTATSSAGSPQQAPPPGGGARGQLAAAQSELAAKRAERAAAEADLDAAKSVLNPFSTSYNQDPNAFAEATKKAQDAQARIDATKSAEAALETKVADLERQVRLEPSAGSAVSPQSPSQGEGDKGPEVPR